MNFPFFIAQRITYRSQRSFTRVILRIAMIAIVLSVAVMIISDAIVTGFQSEIKNKITGFAAHVQVNHTRTNFALDNVPIYYDDTFVTEIKQMEGVRHVHAFATKPGLIKADSAIEGVVLKGVNKGFDWEAFAPNMQQGKPLQLNDTITSTDVVLSNAIADRLQLAVGDTAQIYFVQRPVRALKLHVSGIYSTGIEEIDHVFVLADMKQIQFLNSWEDNQVGGYEIFLNDLKALDTIGEKVHFRADANQEALTIKERYPQIFDWLGLLDVNIQVILTLMTLVAIINMITALLIMILERTQMIGLLKALGSYTGQLQQIFVYNAMILIAIGIVAGNFIAIGLLMLQKTLHLIKLPQESYYVSEVPVQFNWMHILVINIGAFIICSLAMYLPSLLISRIRPVKAIRFE
ncbi:MAG: ABC transporter permease [Bacteroidota bacterium]|nr:ABC transporter permease [Bacteroidota bacterium]